MFDINWQEYEKVERDASPAVKTKHWYSNKWLLLVVMGIMIKSIIQLPDWIEYIKVVVIK
jgi:hypothetical protein